MSLVLAGFADDGELTMPICQTVADPFGDHQVGGGDNGDWIHRHNSVQDALFSSPQSAALVPWKEIPALIPGT